MKNFADLADMCSTMQSNHPISSSPKIEYSDSWIRILRSPPTPQSYRFGQKYLEPSPPPPPLVRFDLIRIQLNPILTKLRKIRLMANAGVWEVSENMTSPYGGSVWGNRYSFTDSFLRSFLEDFLILSWAIFLYDKLICKYFGKNLNWNHRIFHYLNKSKTKKI